MSQCHKCDKPCGHVLTFQIPSTLPYCVIGPVLEALPDATEEQIEAARLILDFTVRPTVYRDGKIEFLTYKPQVRREWTQRDKEA